MVVSSKKKLSKLEYKLFTFIKKVPVLSYWRTIMFIAVAIGLFFIVFYNFDFVSFFKSVKKLSFVSLLWLFLLSVFEQFLSWIRFRFFLQKTKKKQVVDYVASSTVGYVVPPKPLGLYYRFILTKRYFNTNIQDSIFLIVIDTFFEGISALIFALFALFIFPTANLGLNFFLIALAGIGVLYIILSYYEARVYLIKNKFIKKILGYFSKLKERFLKSFYQFLKQKVLYLIIGFVLSIAKLFIGVLKAYLIFGFFGYNVSFWTSFGLWSIAYFVGTGSSLPGGLGAFELSFVYLAKTINIPEELALSVALVERFFNVWIWAIFTGLYFMFRKTQFWVTNKTFLLEVSSFISKLNKNVAKITGASNKEKTKIIKRFVNKKKTRKK